MLAIAGKDLAAGDPEAAVRLLNRLRRDQRQVGARLWLGETHAGRPPTRRKIWDVQPLLRFSTMGEEELDRGLREGGADVEGHVGPVPNPVNRALNRGGNTGSSPSPRRLEREQSGLQSHMRLPFIVLL